MELLIIKSHNHSLQNMIEITEYDLVKEKKKTEIQKFDLSVEIHYFFLAQKVYKWTDKSKLAAGLICMFYFC